jgi:hypothetical protein
MEIIPPSATLSAEIAKQHLPQKVLEETTGR